MKTCGAWGHWCESKDARERRFVCAREEGHAGQHVNLGGYFFWNGGEPAIFRLHGAQGRRSADAVFRSLSIEDCWRSTRQLNRDKSRDTTQFYRVGKECTRYCEDQGRLCQAPMLWNGAQWVCADGHIQRGNYDADGVAYEAPNLFAIDYIPLKVDALKPDEWYAEETKAFRAPAASNRAHGAIRMKFDRWRDGLIRGSR